MDFKEGGYWLYAMVGPAGAKHWALAEYKKIIPEKMYIAYDSFCDEKGNKMPETTGMEWKVNFEKTATGTKVSVEITFASEKDLQTIVEMGFQEGFSMAHDNLDELFANAEIKS